MSEEPTDFTCQTAKIVLPRHCEEHSCPPKPRLRAKADATKQSSFFTSWRQSWIASSLSLLAMTGRYVFAISRRPAPEVWKNPSPHEGVGNAGRRCTRSRAWCVVNTRVSHHESTGTTRHSRTQWF